jgi:aryl-alcohol dehydrogenase-like predicted oxidoreductase
LKRLGTDHIDLLQLHAFDAGTPVEEVLLTLDELVRGQAALCRRLQFSGWQVMKSLAQADKRRLPALCRASGLLFAGRPRL